MIKIINLKNDEKLEKLDGKILIITKSQLLQVFDSKTEKEIINSLRLIESNKIDSYNGKFLLTFNFINTDANKDSMVEKIGVYSDFKTFSVYVTENKTSLIEKIENLKNLKLDHAGILLSLISDATDNDYLKLENLENEINSFDEKLAKERNLEKYARKISYYKRHLIKLKHYYEQINYITDFFAGHSEFLEEQEGKDKLSMLSRRIPKLVKETVSLMDNVSQIRENYQSQIQIKQSNLMKIFTIITAICMPLQLITGWYGMNFMMPEFNSIYSYPIIIAVCIIIVTAMIIIFKKKKWFK